MKRIIIVEDEQPAASRLQKMILALGDPVKIEATLDSVEDAVLWFQEHPHPDLAFFDIQLADGLSFNIFERTNVECPVIFTTAYDQYAIKAFKVNSIDYLLKPVSQEELKTAWDKFVNLQSDRSKNLPFVLAAMQQLQERKEFKERFLIKKGDQFKYLKIKDVAYFYSENGLSFLIDHKGARYVIDDKIDTLEHELSPKQFFRINRKFVVGESAVSKISNYFNSRLILELQPSSKEEVIVARERVPKFKKWLNR